jgi:hypothetical protein
MHVFKKLLTQLGKGEYTTEELTTKFSLTEAQTKILTV